MPIILDKIDPKARPWFVPDVRIGGVSNRKDPDPFAVQISACTAAEFRELERGSVSVTKGDDENYISRVLSIRDKIFDTHVHAVRGFQIRDAAGKLITPTDGASLRAALAELDADSAEVVRSAILNAITDASVLRAGLLEQLGPPSGS